MLLKLADIVVDHDRLPREELTQDAVERYVDALREAGDEWPFPPVKVSENDDGTYQLWVGQHRLTAATECGWDQIPAELLEGELIDFYSEACQSNNNHGQPPTPADRRRAVEVAMLLFGQNLSGNALADITGLSRTTCLKYRHEINNEPAVVVQPDKPSVTEELFGSDEDDVPEVEDDPTPEVDSKPERQEQPDSAPAEVPEATWTLEALQAFHDSAHKTLNNMLRTLKEITEAEEGAYIAHAETRIKEQLTKAKTSLYQLRPMSEGGPRGFVVRSEVRK